MKYTLVKPDGSLGDTRDFTGAPPTLAPNKGKWLPDNPPAYNPDTHTIGRGPQAMDNPAIVYAVNPREFSVVVTAKLAELRAARNAACEVPVVVAGNPFVADMEAQTGFKRLGDRMRRGKPSSLTHIPSATGTLVPLNQALLENIEDAIAVNTEAAWAKFNTKLQAVMAATAVGEVNAISW